MLYTREWVAEKYNYYNKLIFENKLPDFSQVTFMITRAERTWGQGGCLKWVKTTDEYGNRIYKAQGPLLKLSNYFDVDEKIKINVLVHEMVHIYEFFVEDRYITWAVTHRSYSNSGYPKNGHGVVFYKMADYIRNNFGIDITRFVKEEYVDSAKFNDRIYQTMKKRAENGIPLFLFKYKEGKLCKGYQYGYAKVSSNKLNAWEKRIINEKFYIDKFEWVKLYSTYSIEANKMTTKSPGHWSLTDESRLNDIIKKCDAKFEKYLIGGQSMNEEESLKKQIREAVVNQLNKDIDNMPDVLPGTVAVD